MKSVKVSTGNSSEPSILRLVAEEFDNSKRAISCLFDIDRFKDSYELWYAEMYWNHSEQELSNIQTNCDEGEYEYLGHDGIVLFLLFLAEYEENP